MATTTKPKAPRKPKPEKPKASGKKPVSDKAPAAWTSGASDPDEDDDEEDEDEGTTEMQERLPGMQDAGIPELEKAIKLGHELAKARMAAQEEENEQRDKIIGLLHKYQDQLPKSDGDIMYSFGGIVARLSMNEKLTVKKKANDKHEDD